MKKKQKEDWEEKKLWERLDNKRRTPTLLNLIL